MIGFIKNRIEDFINRRVDNALSMSALDIAIDIATGNQIEGDYLEFGVYTGQSFIRVYKRFKKNCQFYDLATNIRFFAFDSFEGLPGSNEEYKPTQYREGAYHSGEAVFLRNLENSGVNLSEVVVIKKWYGELNEQVKEDHALIKASVIYLDCDLYESTRDALSFVSNLIQDGTIVVLDDYYRHKCSADAGVRKAWEEFLNKNQRFKVTMVHNFRRLAFAINIKKEDVSEK